MTFIKQAALALALASTATAASAAVSGSAFIDFTSFSYNVVDTDLGDGITPTLSFEEGESAATIFSNNWNNNLFSGWEPGMTPASTISGSASGASVLNSDTSMQAQGSLASASASLHRLTAESTKSAQFSLSGPGAVVFKVNYSLSSSDNDVHDSFFASVNASIYGSVSFEDGTDSYFGSQQSSFYPETRSGTLKATFYNESGNANGYLSLTTGADLGQTAPVPEPSEYLMLLAGLGVIGYAVRRRQA